MRSTESPPGDRTSLGRLALGHQFGNSGNGLGYRASTRLPKVGGSIVKPACGQDAASSSSEGIFPVRDGADHAHMTLVVLARSL